MRLGLSIPGVSSSQNSSAPTVPLGEASKVWARIAVQSFGGPAGQIAVMHRIVVEEKKWVSEERFLHALSYCMLLPGPEAQQLAIYLGWLLHRTRGGLVAGILFVLPGVAAILALSFLYVFYRDTWLIAGLFYGLKPAVLAVVAEATVRIGRRALVRTWQRAVAAGAFVAIFALALPFPLILALAALAGLVAASCKGAPLPAAVLAEEEIAPAPWRWLRVLASGLLLWSGPPLICWLWLGREHVLVDQALFFSKAAVITFGGAYAVLAYIGQQAVETYGWLSPGEMLDGLGLAETTPGPLILVVQFVAFLGAYRHPGSLDPLTCAIFGSLLTVWVTFVPSFLWIFLGAPYIEKLRGNARLSAALSGITAAVVGVIANLALFFALHTLFHRVNQVLLGPIRLDVPVFSTWDPALVAIAVFAFVALFLWKLGMGKTLALSSLIGLLASI